MLYFSWPFKIRSLSSWPPAGLVHVLEGEVFAVDPGGSFPGRGHGIALCRRGGRMGLEGSGLPVARSLRDGGPRVAGNS